MNLSLEYFDRAIYKLQKNFTYVENLKYNPNETEGLMQNYIDEDFKSRFYLRTYVGAELAKLNSSAVDDDSQEGSIVLPIYALVLILVGIVSLVSYLYCFFCVPSKNKRKIYAMMKEAKLEKDGVH
jgi:hypothetical protein